MSMPYVCPNPDLSPVLQTEQSLGEVLMQDMIATVSLYAKDAGTRQGEGCSLQTSYGWAGCI